AATALVGERIDEVTVLLHPGGDAIAHLLEQQLAVDVVATLGAAVLGAADDHRVLALHPVVVVAVVRGVAQRIGDTHGAVAVVGDAGGMALWIADAGQQLAGVGVGPVVAEHVGDAGELLAAVVVAHGATGAVGDACHLIAVPGVAQDQGIAA